MIGKMENNFKRFIHKEMPCASKWRWSTIRLYQNQTNSCHRTTTDQIPDDFDSFHNTPIKKRTRELMLKGQWPGYGCDYCKNIEKAGGVSDRNDFNNIVTEQEVPIEVFSDPTRTELTPTLIEIYFSNLCNMSCIYCDGNYSTTWNDEERRFNGYSTNPEFFERYTVFDQDRYRNLVEKMFSWLDRNYHHLTDLHILGGEPFIQDEAFRLIDFMETRSDSRLQNLLFSTNLKIENVRFRKALDQLMRLNDTGKIRNIVINPSIDCWGPEIEYIRTGLNMARWEENFSMLVSEYEPLTVNLHCTMTSLSIKSMDRLTNLVNNYNANRHKNKATVSFSIVDGRNFLHPGIFPRGFFDSDFDRIMQTFDDPVSKERLSGLQLFINDCQPRPDLVTKLKRFLTIIDERRGLDWRKTFEWLERFDQDASIKDTLHEDIDHPCLVQW